MLVLHDSARALVAVLLILVVTVPADKPQPKGCNCNDATVLHASEQNLDFLKNKYWDVVVATDWYGIKDPMAIEEDTYFINALKKLGRSVHRESIQDETFDWHSTKSVVVRSAWAKYGYKEEFNNFLDTVNTHAYLFNPRELMRWQSDKINYMTQLANFVYVPQTIVVRHTTQDHLDYDHVVDILGCKDIIIKPSSGNAGIGVVKVNEGDSITYDKEMDQLWEDDKDALIQCFFHSIAHDGIGEISVYLIDGKVTHAGYAKPAEGGYLIHEEHGGMGDDHNATEEEIAYAETVYRAATTITGTKPLYFRVDMVYDNAGDLALMEIACATTDMNFRDEPDAATAMAEAVHAFLKAKESLFKETYGRPVQLIDDETCDELYGLDEMEEKFEYELFGKPMRVNPQNKTTAKRGSEAQLNNESKEECD